MTTGSAKKSPSNGKGQQTLLAFFQKAKDKPSASPPKIAKVAHDGSSALASHATAKDAAALPTPSKSDVSPAVPLNDDNVTMDVSEPSLSTPLGSSQALPSSSPLRSRLKRKKAIVESDSEFEDSSDDWAPSNESKDGALVSADDLESEDDSVAPTPRKRVLKTQHQVQKNNAIESRPPPSSPPSAADISASLARYSLASTYVPDEQTDRITTRTNIPMKKVHVSEDPERYKWLLNIKDANGNSPDDPSYDPRTLHVPNSAWAKFTPFEKQYWEVKQKLWNTVVFFKKGKFYELYENDAAIAHQLFDLKLAGGGRANMSLCGVPEMSFDYWASAFIAKGYKVARVDQAETALSKEMRDIANKKKEEKIIRRELSCVLTGGTLTDSAMLVSDLSQYCMALKQDGLNFAASFVDTATSQFFVTEFTDKSGDYPMLETLLAQTRPKELVIPRGNIEKFALKIIKNNTSVDTLWETVNDRSEFWDADTARREIDLTHYFGEKPAPKALTEALENDLAASAIGGLVWYLRSLKLDTQLMSLGQFDTYDATETSKGATMVVDGQTLQNLEIFANSWDGGSNGTLFNLLNKCVTPFGKRRLRSWVAHPLQRPPDISRRADAVDMLMAQDEVAQLLRDKLLGLPDAERMMSRVHAGGLRPRDFVKLVGGLESMARLLSWLDSLKSQLPQLEPFLHTDTAAVEAAIEPWMTSFDHLAAKEKDLLVPERGVDLEFDSTKAVITDLENELAEIMSTYRQQFRTNALVYQDSGKEIYLIEVPIKLVKQVPRDWQQMGATAKFKRYWSPEVRSTVRRLQEALETHNAAAAAAKQKLYSRFCSENYDLFMNSVRTISAIDCLLSLAATSQSMAVHCRPEFLDGTETDQPTLEFTSLRHPVATSTDFIPNDIRLGREEARISLLTGANAAGKSTILRMTGSAVLLAQIGCHVPAETARLTPVDRIMTRLGASDNIFAGKSTFHMELAETERILSEATPRSLVVLDELGRGGSSSDGFAIAEAVLHHLATHVGCLGFFATHYGTLYDSFVKHPGVKPERMAILVDNSSREVTFLYKLEAGRSEGSFGMNVAAMCGVDPEIVATAERAAEEYEHTSKLKRTGRSQDVSLGLQSDVVWSLSHDVGEYALSIMQAMAS